MLDNMGFALAEEGFILSDDQMAVMRDFWETLSGLNERAAYERIAAKERSLRRS